MTEVAASATPTIRPTLRNGVGPFRYTNGHSPYNLDAFGNAVPTSVIETYGGRIEFGTGGLCWYLDATFCSYFHQLKGHSDAETIKFTAQVINPAKSK